MAQQNAKPQDRLLVFGTVCFYLVAALAMVMANKWVLEETDAPLFFLFTQLVIAVWLFLAAHAARFIVLPLRIEMALVKGLIPMVGLNVVGLSFSNFTLKYVDASFYQVARGLILPFTVLTSFTLLNARPSLRILISCAIITLGFFVGVFLDSVPVSTIGIFFGVTSSAITAVHSVVIKKSLDVVGGSALNLSWYTNLLSAVAMIPIIILAGEVPAVLALFEGPAPSVAMDLAASGDMSVLQKFIWGSIITGTLGFLMSIASLLSIKVTSPITHMVSSAVRGVAASLLGKWFFGDFISFGRAASIAVILGGSIYYTWIKHLESQGGPKPDADKYERVPLEDVETGKGKPE